MFMFAKWKNKKSTIQNKAKEMQYKIRQRKLKMQLSLFLRPDLPSTLIRHENPTFRN